MYESPVPMPVAIGGSELLLLELKIGEPSELLLPLDQGFEELEVGTRLTVSLMVYVFELVRFTVDWLSSVQEYVAGGV